MSSFTVSRAANADIRSIARYTQDTWGRDQRRRYLDGLNDIFEVLAAMPEMAAERRDFRPPVRIHHYEKHLKEETLDFMLSERRDEAAATAFFVKAIGNKGWPNKVVIDKSGSNTAGLFNMNCLLVMHNRCWLIEVLQVKYLGSRLIKS